MYNHSNTEIELAILQTTTYQLAPNHILRLIRKSEGFWFSGEGARLKAKYRTVKFQSIWEMLVMARNWNVEFVNINLDAKQRKEIKALHENDDVDLKTLLDNLTTDGYRVGLAYNPEKDSFTCSLTGTKAAAHNEGLCCVSHAGSAPKALIVATYKHYTICQGGSWKEHAESDADFR